MLYLGLYYDLLNENKDEASPALATASGLKPNFVSADWILSTLKNELKY